ncbi:MAG: azurin [Pseudomonadota bacterium]
MRNKIAFLFLSLAVLLYSNAALAECEFTVEVGDGLSFSVGNAMEVPASCSEVTITLNHTGTLPKEGMGHNWVLTTAADFQAVAQAGIAAGVAANYVPADDARVIAASDLIGGGESTTLTFSTEGMDPAGDYTFFCSFPGHWAIMQGTFKLV